MRAAILIHVRTVLFFMEMDPDPFKNLKVGFILKG